MSDFIEVRALVNVIVIGLIAGAGVPALFALGVRALAGPGSRDDVGRRPRTRVATAIVCFAVVVSAISYAILAIGQASH